MQWSMAQWLGPAKPTMEGYFGKFESSLTRRPVNKYSSSNINNFLQLFKKSQQTFNFKRRPGKRIREPRAIRADKRACLIEFFLGLILILEVNGQSLDAIFIVDCMIAQSRYVILIVYVSSTFKTFFSNLIYVGSHLECLRDKHNVLTVESLK